MRSREQFKAYVYAKAEAEQAQGRKRRRLMFSGIAACLVCICVISAAFLMPHGFNNKNETMADGAPSLDAFATDATYAPKRNAQPRPAPQTMFMRISTMPLPAVRTALRKKAHLR